MKTHDNDVYFFCNEISSFRFDVIGHSITSGQSFEGVTEACKDSGGWKITVKAGRKGSGSVAGWFKDKVLPGKATATKNHGDWPDELNFAVEGTLLVVADGKEYKSNQNWIIAQGHTAGGYNNWWLGSKDMGNLGEGSGFSFLSNEYSVTLSPTDGKGEQIALSFTEKDTNEFNMQLTKQHRGLEVPCHKEKLDGQKHRCSDNFSTKLFPKDKPFVWMCPDGVTFTVMEAKKAATDNTVFKNVGNRTITPYKDAENLYIADVKVSSGMSVEDVFTVTVCPVTYSGVDELTFSSISDLHLGATEEGDIVPPETKGVQLRDYQGEDKALIEEKYSSDRRLVNLEKALLEKEGGSFTIIQGDITTGTKNNQLDKYKDCFIPVMEQENCMPMCEGWGNHDVYCFSFSANVGNFVKDRNRDVRKNWLPDFHFGDNDSKDAADKENGHYCFKIQLRGNGYADTIPVNFFMLNLYPGYGNLDHPENEYSRSKNNPFYSAEFLKKYLPENKDEIIFIAFHYNDSEGYESLDELCEGYTNVFLLTGHDHSNDYITPNVGKSTYITTNGKRIVKFVCAGGMNTQELKFLTVNLKRTGEKTVQMTYKWVTRCDGDESNTCGDETSIVLNYDKGAD